MKFFLLIGCLLAPLAFAAPHHEPPETVVLAPGYSNLTFDAPEPGSYQLPVLGQASDGDVVLESAEASTLHELLTDRFVVLSFIFTQCTDVNGCPLASYVLSKVQKQISADESLQGKVRFLSLSFDRTNDSPEVLSQYRDNFRDNQMDWRFLGTPSDEALANILDAYDQYVIEDRSDTGEKIGSFSHILRVYLIDTQQQIRNIYSVSFLHPDIVWNDMRTLMLESQ